MKTTPVTDYFAPLGRSNLFEELSKAPVDLPITFFLPTPSEQLAVIKLWQFDPVDRFTYIIMGLAVLIAILVPLLNLN